MILVTGAEGFIGSHVVEELVSQGHRVRAMVLYNSFSEIGWLRDVSPDVKNEIEVIFGDVRDSEGLTHAMRGCDSVIHLAALIGIPYSYTHPRSYIETNIIGTLNTLEASRELGLQKVVLTSTSEVYGTAQSVPINESHRLNAQSPYAATKVGADQLGMSYFSSFGVPVAIVRPFNTFGPRQSLRAVIPSIVLQLISNERVIKLGNVATTRDFSFVKDSARGIIAGLTSKDSVGQVVNLGSGFEISIKDVVHVVGSMLGVEPEIEIDEHRLRPKLSEVERLFADNSLAKSLLGWEPQFSGLDGFKAALRETVSWYHEPANREQFSSLYFQQ